MRSRLYRARVTHRRDRPKSHRFSYNCFMFCIDLDEVDLLDRTLSLFSHNKPNLYSLKSADHLDEGKRSLKGNILHYLKDKGLGSQVGRIELVTNLRTWGYVFNPVSFFFVYAPQGHPLCAVAEVANTFNEQKLYYLDDPDPAEGRLRQSHDKLFYISPFSEPDTKLNFKLTFPNDRIALSISEADSKGTYFHASLSGGALPLSNRSLAICTARFPFMTLSVIAQIHWEALRLYLKKIPYFRKSHKRELQAETRVYLKPRKPKPTSIQ